MVKVQVEVAYHGNVLLRSSTRLRLERVHADIDIPAVGVFEFEPRLESRPGQLLGRNEALNDLVFLAALDHNRQPVAGLEVVLYVFPRGDGLFCMTLVPHLLPPAVLFDSGLLDLRDEPQEVRILADGEIDTRTEGDGQLEEVLDPCG